MTLREVVDGLVLAGAQVDAAGGLRLVSRQHEWLWDRAAAAQARGLEASVVRSVLTLGDSPTGWRWRDGTESVPDDLELNAQVLAAWFSGRGQLANGGYSIRFTMPRFGKAAVEGLGARLRSRYAWEPEVFWNYNAFALRLSQSGDRMGLRRLIAPFVLPAFARKLNGIRESAPVSAGEGARRRAPRVLAPEDVTAIRERARGGETYRSIAPDFGVSAGHVGHIARNTRAQDPDALAIRQYRRRTRP